ncbi:MULTISPECIES: NYN domain-containing protein [Actinomyces]|uniref:NYN domain-containing protein n=2 Tax=Actinomyces TaxID=1654 RepID=A0A1M4RYZ9_9ACTO|nr:MULTISPECIES: NYN domain-containing protein [Actinomyces]CED92175.1 NYN domain [Actinomyces succiniciruminis]SHE25204.1 Hypothetical protein ACGLYG10_1420 [Actinomyces glycerinitolerans]
MDSSLRVVVVMDYQNVHLTAHGIFVPDRQLWEALISPMNFARTAVRRRNDKQRSGFPPGELAAVYAFRGLPNSAYDSAQHRRATAQAHQWRQEGAIVELRDLKYDYQRQADGTPATNIHGRKIPTGPGREKGVDVLVALTCMRQAQRNDIDVVILASRDTDLVPVLDTLVDMRKENAAIAKIETVAWFDSEQRKGGSLRPTGGRRVWNTNMDRACFEASLDRHDYR